MITGATGAMGRPANRGQWRRHSAIGIIRLLVLGAFLVFWQWGANTGRLNTFFTSSPNAIWAVLVGWIQDRTIFGHIYVTLYEAGAGFFLGLVTGVPIGFAFARSRFVDEIFKPFVDVLNATPRLALVPLFVLWLGLGSISKIALVYSVVVFVFILNVAAGIKGVEPEYIRTARLLGASKLQVDIKVVLPAVVPMLFAGIRLSVAYALAAAVVAEIVAANSGLGFLIGEHTGLLDTTGALAATVALMTVAWIVTTIPTVLEKRLLSWQNFN